MYKLTGRINIKQWLDFKPYDHQHVTDTYYLKLCNLVKQAISTNKQSLVLQNYFDNEEIDILACFLTSYFEDLISETNLWNTFIKVHKRLYGKPLPFYETGEYYENEINQPDICLLIWYFINTIQQDNFFAPFNDFVFETSDKVMDVFESAWEYAPENEFLKTFYSIDDMETDYYAARKLIDNVLFKSYLFYPDILLDLRDSEYEILNESKNDEHLLNYLNENRDQKLQNSFTRLLGLKGQEWVAEILGNNHSLSKEFSEISMKIQGYFFYKGQDDKNIFLEHIASGKKFNLTKRSFDHYDELTDIDTILFMGIVQWRKEWWFSGVYFQSEFNPDLVLDEKKSIISRNTVAFLDHQKKNVDDILRDQLEAFKKFNANQPIAFMDSDDIGAFIERFIEFYNDSLKLSQTEIEETRQRAMKDGFLGHEQEPTDFSKISKSGLVFFNPKGGTEIALGINSAFPVKNNPYYDEDESEEHIMRLFLSEGVSTELAMFCIENFRNKLKFFDRPEGRLYLDNIDFLLRFWKRGNYFTKPAISYAGKEK